MQPVKLGGLTLKSEEKKEELKEEESDFPINPNDATEEPVEDFEFITSSTLQEDLESIIKRVEEFPKDDNTIKALGKLKGALELLS